MGLPLSAAQDGGIFTPVGLAGQSCGVCVRKRWPLLIRETLQKVWPQALNCLHWSTRNWHWHWHRTACTGPHAGAAGLSRSGIAHVRPSAQAVWS
eukprot:scaffold35997_cov20-Tisochrysis_lutea.AAC.1